MNKEIKYLFTEFKKGKIFWKKYPTIECDEEKINDIINDITDETIIEVLNYSLRLYKITKNKERFFDFISDYIVYEQTEKNELSIDGLDVNYRWSIGTPDFNKFYC